MVHLTKPHSNLIKIYPILDASLILSDKLLIKPRDRIAEIMLYDERIDEREIDEIAEVFVKYVKNDYYTSVNERYAEEMIDDVVIRVFKRWKEFHRYIKNAYGFLWINPNLLLMKYHDKKLWYKYYGLVVGEKQFIPRIIVVYPLVNFSFGRDFYGDSSTEDDLDNIFRF